MKCYNPLCSKPGMSHCAKCKTANYCGKQCQTAHWKVHKATCNKALPARAGIFPFLRLPREVRDQIYEDFFVHRLSVAHQKEWDDMVADQDMSDIVKRAQLDVLLRETVIEPGRTTSDHKQSGYPHIFAGVGLLLVNKQLHAEANSVLFSKNLLMIGIHGRSRYHVVDRKGFACINLSDRYYIAKDNFDQIQRLYILVGSILSLDDDDYQKSVVNISHNLNEVVTHLNSTNCSFKTLNLLYGSFCTGDAMVMMDDIEALARPPMKGQKPPRDVRMTTADGRFCNLSTRNVKDFLLPANTIGTILPRLTRPVAQLETIGDMPQSVIKRLEAKFGPTNVAISKLLSAKAKTTNGKNSKAGSGRQLSRKHRAPGENAFAAFRRQRKDRDDFFRDLIARNPNDPGMQQLAGQMLDAPIYSPSVMYNLMQSPTMEEIAAASRRTPY